MRNETLSAQLKASFYRGNRANLALAAFGVVVSSSLNLILSWILQQLIDTASGHAGAYALDTLACISGGFILLCLAASLIDYVSLPRFIERALRQYKELAFRRLTEKSIASFRQEDTAAYLSALTNDAGVIEADYLSRQLDMAGKLLTFLGALGLMLYYSPLMTAIAAGFTVLPLIASLLTGSRLADAEKRVSDRNREFTAALTDCLGGFSVVKSFQAEKEIFHLFCTINRQLEGEKFTKRRIKILVGMIGSAAGIIAQMGVFVTSTWLSLSGFGLTPGMIIVFVNLMNFMIQPVAELPGLLASRRAAAGLVDKLAAALEKESGSAGGERLARLEQGIGFEDVSFSYEGERCALSHISLSFAAGRAYAIVGGSGSGKSTLLNLLTGAAGQGYSGRILLDGKELREISAESLFGALSVIQQNVFVFNASIRDNITLFRDFPDAEVEEAIRRARLEGLLARRGEDELCGESGKALSGGERQRVSIARGLLKKASILIADEATASLDAETAHQVVSDLLGLEGTTRLIVTHTLDAGLLRRCDGIIALRDGAVAEQGGFDELMEKKGYFYALYTVSH